jgi:hypothetical protein
VTVRAGDSRLELTTLDDAVGPEVFTPPAPITS